MTTERFWGNTPRFLTWGVSLLSETTALRIEVLMPGYYRLDGHTYPFHHIRDGANSLRLDLADGRYTLFINRERVTSGDIPSGPLTWSVFDDGGVGWQEIAIYGPER